MLYIYNKTPKPIFKRFLEISICIVTLFLNGMSYAQSTTEKNTKKNTEKNIETHRTLQFIYPEGEAPFLKKGRFENTKNTTDYQHKKESLFNLSTPSKLQNITSLEWTSISNKALSSTDYQSFKGDSKINPESFGKLPTKQISFGKANENKRYITTHTPHKDDTLYKEGGNKEVFTDIELGTFKTHEPELYLYVLDYGSIDGDIIKIYNNEKLIHADFYLTRQLKGYKIPLEYGFNKVAIVGVSHGTDRPLTCYLEVRDSLQNKIHRTKYALSVGFKAELLFIKN